MYRNSNDGEINPNCSTKWALKLFERGELTTRILNKSFPGKKLFIRFESSEWWYKNMADLEDMIYTYHGWDLGAGKWDAIIFEPTRDVVVYGIGIYL